MERFETFEITIRRISSNGSTYRKDAAWLSLRWTGGEALPAYWFLFSTQDVGDVMRGYASSLNDVAHNARITGDFWTFYDLDFPNKASGEMTIKYEVVKIPRFFLRVLQRYALKVLPTLNDLRWEHRLSLPKKMRERICRIYGQGVGSVKVEMSDSARKIYEAHKSAELDERLQRLEDIARNGTYRVWDVGTVALYEDGDRDFYFNILGPDGRRTMNGGVINHGESGAPDWSIHT